jgi:colanic acid biosynthesis glycosyl transferase WcaI
MSHPIELFRFEAEAPFGRPAVKRSIGTWSIASMRILVVNQYFHPDQSATAQLLTELCEDLSERHDVTVVCGRPSYSPVEARGPSGFIEYERHGSFRVLRTWSTAFSRHSIPGRVTNYATYLASSLVGIMRAEHPDVILTMTDPPFVAAAAMAASKLRRSPFVYVNADVFPEVALALGVLQEGIAARGLRLLNATLRSSAAAVVAIGRDMEQRLLTLGTPAEKLHVIPNWADTKAIVPLEGPSPLREAYGWGGRFVVMHSGNVGLSQSLEALIEAAELLRSTPDVLIAIVGEGGAKASLVRRATDLQQDNVLFLPYQPKSELSESLGAADLHFVGLRRGLAGFIVPSKVYGIMAAGRPFLAAVEPMSEPDRLIDEFRCGLRVDPENPSAIADGIRRARTMDLEEMGRRGRLAAEQRFERTMATEAYRQLLEATAKRPRLA